MWCFRCKYPPSGIAWLYLLRCCCLSPLPQAITLRLTLLVPMSGKEDKASSSSIPSSIRLTESTLRYLWWIFHGLNGFVSGMDALFPVFLCTKHTYSLVKNKAALVCWSSLLLEGTTKLKLRLMLVAAMLKIYCIEKCTPIEKAVGEIVCFLKLVICFFHIAHLINFELVNKSLKVLCHAFSYSTSHLTFLLKMSGYYAFAKRLSKLKTCSISKFWSAISFSTWGQFWKHH